MNIRVVAIAIEWRCYRYRGIAIDLINDATTLYIYCNGFVVGVAIGPKSRCTRPISMPPNAMVQIRCNRSTATTFGPIETIFVCCLCLLMQQWLLEVIWSIDFKFYWFFQAEIILQAISKVLKVAYQFVYIRYVHTYVLCNVVS